MTLPAVCVWWRFGRAGDASLPAVADAAGWLTSNERERAASLKTSKRRDDWLVGRLNLKALLVALVEARYGQRCHPSHVYIARLPSGAPSVRLSSDAAPVGPFGPGSPLPLSVSNSHSGGAALAAALWTDSEVLALPDPSFQLPVPGVKEPGVAGRGPGPAVPDPSFEIPGPSPASRDPSSESRDPSARRLLAVGADLELVEPRSDGFVRDFLTSEEQAYCGESTGATRDLRANLVWSAKEAVLKVLQLGLSADTWWLTCLPNDADEPERIAPDIAPLSDVGVAPDTGHNRAAGVSPRARVTLAPDPETWRTFTVRCDPRLGADGIAFAGSWRALDGFVATVAVGARAVSPLPRQTKRSP